MNKQEALLKAQELAAIGYDLYPCDIPHEGKNGIVCIKRVVDADGNWLDEDLVEELYWPMFTEHTTINASEVDAKTFAKFMDGTGLCCDKPRELKLGYMKYDSEKDQVNVQFLPIRHLRDDLPAEELEAFTTLREEYKARTEKTVGNRMLEIAAITAAVKNA